ncbi:hypothetical protein AAFF_G00344620 [Aldrovandia affinis]|uniref:Uncharacterized protein n=1 Tax=Aldrovandia affinis TaxID=143900 RepID=A0AAD7WP45_9TELE|nr:hypothetical protein AAFF_G00344620 [Aldrovandia affinis]
MTTLSCAFTPSSNFSRLLREFPDLNRPTFSTGDTKRGVEHHMPTTGPPVHARACHIDPAKLAIAKAKFANMERFGIVHRSSSPWASPLHFVPKPDGCRRPYGDSRRLNNVTTPDWYPVLHM